MVGGGVRGVDFHEIEELIKSIPFSQRVEDEGESARPKSEDYSKVRGQRFRAAGTTNIASCSSKEI